MAEPGNGLNHVTAIRQELEVLVIIANRWVTEFLVVQLRRASPCDFKVRFGEICLHAGKPVSLTPRRLLKYWSGSPATVALILRLTGVARWAEIAADIGAALRALANAKIHSNATHSSISTVSEGFKSESGSLTHLFFAPWRLGVGTPLDCISKETRGPSRTGVE